MAETPKISVIVPTFNRAGYIVETLNSIAAQSRLPFEVIVADDGSTDDTEAVVKAIAEKTTAFKIHYLRQPNQGPSAARNMGIRAAQGDWIAFLDADDVWEPDKLEWQGKLLDLDPSIDAVYCNFSVIDSDGNWLDTGFRRRMEWHWDRDKMFRLFLGGNHCYGSASAVVIRRASMRAELFDESLRLGEDWEYWMRLARMNRFVLIERPLVRIREHATNLQKGRSKHAHYDMMVYAKWRKEIHRDRRARSEWETRISDYITAVQTGQPWALEWWKGTQPADRALLKDGLRHKFSLMGHAGLFGRSLVDHLKAFAISGAKDAIKIRRQRKFLDREP